MKNLLAPLIKNSYKVITLSTAVYLAIPPINIIPLVPVVIGDDPIQEVNINVNEKVWDFSNLSDYNFDNLNIEIISGKAQLKSNLPSNWYDSSWNYRREIRISNSQNSNDLTDFQIEIKLDSSNFDFSKIKSDGSDIRFTASDGVTLLDHWIEHFDYENGSIFILVKVPHVGSYSQETIYFYFGNKTLNVFPQSNFDETFSPGISPVISSIINSGGFNAFPAVEKIDNDFLVTFRRGSAHISSDGKIMSVRSTDNGNTWSTASLVYDDLTIDDRVDLGLKKLSNGILLQPFYKYSTNGTVAISSFITRSNNGGISWDTPTNIQVDGHVLLWLAVYGQIIELENGTLLLPAYGLFENMEGTKAVLLQSINNGNTWGLKSIIAGEGVNYNEASVLRISDSDYLAVVRDGSIPTRLHKVLSFDGGNTWTEPVFLFDGASPNLIKLNSGDLLLSVVDRVDVSGIRTQVSHDNGATWENPRLIDKDYITEDLGYPASFESNGQIMTVYYKDGYGIKRASYFEDFINSNPNYNNFFDGIENDGMNYWRLWRKLGGWSMFTASGDIKHSGNYSLLINDLSAEIHPTILRSFDFGQDVGSVSFWIYPEVINQGYEFGLLSGYGNAQNKRFWMRVNPEGFIEYLSSQPGFETWIPLSNSPRIEIGKWTKVNLNFNSLANEALLLINGNQVGSIGPRSLSGSINYLGYSVGSLEGVGDRVRIDDIYTKQYVDFIPSVQIGSEEGVYPTDNPFISPVSINLGNLNYLYSFSEISEKNGGEIKYQLSNNGGNSWLWFNGLNWITGISDYAYANTASEVNLKIRSFPVGNGNVIFKAYLHSDGGQQIRLDEVKTKYILRPIPSHPMPISD